MSIPTNYAGLVAELDRVSTDWQREFSFDGAPSEKYSSVAAAVPELQRILTQVMEKKEFADALAEIQRLDAETAAFRAEAERLEAETVEFERQIAAAEKQTEEVRQQIAELEANLPPEAKALRAETRMLKADIARMNSEMRTVTRNARLLMPLLEQKGIFIAADALMEDDNILWAIIDDRLGAMFDGRPQRISDATIRAFDAQVRSVGDDEAARNSVLSEFKSQNPTRV